MKWLLMAGYVWKIFFPFFLKSIDSVRLEMWEFVSVNAAQGSWVFIVHTHARARKLTHSSKCLNLVVCVCVHARAFFDIFILKSVKKKLSFFSLLSVLNSDLVVPFWGFAYFYAFVCELIKVFRLFSLSLSLLSSWH